MDFLDPKAERRHQIRLFVGYALIALIIGTASILLLARSYGYGVGRNGDVKQGGLVFVSSQPTGADVWLSGKRMSNQTNTRLSLDSGTYEMSLSRQGYQDWKRTITVNGGDVQRFDYPLLIPKTLKATDIGPVIPKVTIATQSPDRRWILLGDATRAGVFVSYDLKEPKKPTVTEFVLPSTVYSATATDHTWEEIEWSTDNIHVLLNHGYTEGTEVKHEYILLNRNSPEKSRNISKDLSLSPEEVPSLFDRKVAKYFVYHPDTKTLRIVSADASESGLSAGNVLAYKTFGDDTLLYVTNTYPSGKPVEGKAFVVIQHGLNRQLIRTMPASDRGYILDLAKYDDNWYATVGTKDGSGVYIYKNPDKVPAKETVPHPWRFLRIDSPNYVSFSQNTRFVLAQSSDKYAIYDAETTDIYRYGRSAPLEAPQKHATWMDGHRLMYVSNGRVEMFDYDNINGHSLMVANPTYTPFLSPNFRYMFTVADKEGGVRITSLSFLIHE